MSNQILKITGKKESKTYKNKYEDVDISFTQFYGGKERGISLQITIGNQYVQLDKKQTEAMITMLAMEYNLM